MRATVYKGECLVGEEILNRDVYRKGRSFPKCMAIVARYSARNAPIDLNSALHCSRGIDKGAGEGPRPKLRQLCDIR